MLRMLKNKRALQIARTVQSGRELKMAFEQCAGLPKDFEQAPRRLISFFGRVHLRFIPYVEG
jgi:hypothetical protein